MKRDPLVVFAIAAFALAVLPASWLTGDLGGRDADVVARLEKGTLVWRLAWPLLGAFLLAARRVGGPVESGVRRATGPLALLAVAALAVRIPGLDGGLWFDEIWMLVDFIRQPVTDSIRYYETDNNHTLYTLSAWSSVQVFGEAPWSLRLPALLCGVGSVVAAYAFARARGEALEALLVAGLLIVSSHHVWFSQNARGYTGLLLLTVLSSHALLRALDRGARRDWITHGLCLAGATWIHLTGVYVAIAHLIVILACGVKGRRLPAICGMGLATLLSLALHALVLPQMVWFFFLREGREAVTAEWTNPIWTALEAARSLGLGTAGGVLALALAATVGVAGTASWWRRDRAVALLAVIPAAVGAAVLLALGRNVWPRFFFFVAAFGLMVVVRGLFALAELVIKQRGRRVATALCVLAMAASLWTCRRAWFLPKQDFPAAAAWIESYAPEPSVTAGLATFPLEEWLSIPAKGVESADEVLGLLARTPYARVYVVYTFPVYIESRHPDLWRLIEERGREVIRFPGSVGGGDIVVVEIRRPS